MKLMYLLNKIITILLVCLIIMLLWNYLLIDVCKGFIREINYFEAIGLKYLFTLMTTSVSTHQKILRSNKI